jgi:hypothetical protein
MKKGETRKVPTNKTNYMSDEAFADLREAMEVALAFERGKRRHLKVTRIQAQRAPLFASGFCNGAEYQSQNCSGVGKVQERPATHQLNYSRSPKNIQACCLMSE